MPPIGPRDERLVGAACALAAFLTWGVLPIYFKAIAAAPPLEIVAHRIVWSALLLLGVIALRHRWAALRRGLADRRTRRLLLASTLLVSSNWLIFVWAITSGRVLESSLGYYINPLMNVLLGLLVLRERLSRVQGLAVLLAAVGVANLAVQSAAFPWVALSLAGTFSLYGLVRKTMALGALDGLFVETNLLLVPALIFLAVQVAGGDSAFLAGDTRLDLLLVLSGLFTTLPLLLFTSAVRRLNYATVGLFQYIVPTSHFLLAVFVFGERFTSAHLVTFALIWTALALYSGEVVRVARRRRTA